MAKTLTHLNIGNIRTVIGTSNKGPIVEPQRSYMWQVEIFNDVYSASDTLRNLKFFLKSAVIPQMAKEPMIIDYMGEKHIFAGKDSSTHTITMTFYDDESLTIIRYFNTWMRSMGEIKTGISVNKDQYGREIAIKMKDATDSVTNAEIILTNAFPIEMSDIPLSYETSDPVEVSVTLSFDDRIIDQTYEFDFSFGDTDLGFDFRF